MTSSQAPKYNRAFIIMLMLIVASLHFVAGPHYEGPYAHYVHGYLIDILLPFALYFLLCMYEKSIFRNWYGRFCGIFLLGASIETAQYFDVPLFGSTYDPFDYAAYAVGVLSAAILDQIVIPTYCPALLHRASADKGR